LVFLATNLGRERPDVALDLCHAGFREFPEDARFSVCLAELYRYLGDTEGALQYYEATLEADPSPENFEQVLHFMVLQLEERLNEEDSEGARDTYERTERVLQSFLEHHPNAQPPIREDQLTYLIGMGEFNVGNIDQAVERFEASVANRPNRLALIQLGVIAERRGEGEQAIRRYRAALDLNDGQEGEDPLSRAVVLTHLADAYTLAGNTDRARTMYNEALEMLRVAATTLPPESDPAIMMERGFILYKLGRTDEGAEELQRALSIAPQRRATYGQLLSFYVGRGMVDRSLEVFRLAFNHSELERSWKIYYSMWIVGLQRRLSLEPDAVALRYLESVEGQEWIDRLGRYFVGTLSYQELLDSTESQGQRAEVYYYEAVLELGRGNRDHAAHLLGQVIETNMLGYFEYEFARRLQEELSLTPPQSNASATR
jgi:tetratricopeptide (TPR) repeat protein